MKVGCVFPAGVVEVTAADRAAATVRRGGYPQSDLRLTAPSAEEASIMQPRLQFKTGRAERLQNRSALPYFAPFYPTPRRARRLCQPP